MIHKTRRFAIADAHNAETLAEKLTQHTWTNCTGFRYRGFLFLNDSFGADSAQEYAIVREADSVQVESITFGWCSKEEALDYIVKILEGDATREYGKVEVLKHEPGSCYACA